VERLLKYRSSTTKKWSALTAILESASIIVLIAELYFDNFSPNLDNPNGKLKAQSKGE